MTARANLASVLRCPATRDACALIDLSQGEERRYTYRELDGMASGVAAALRERGYRAGARVGLLLGNAVEFYAAYFGALRAGLTVVPYNPRAGEESIAHVCRDSALDLLICDEPAVGVPGGLTMLSSSGKEFRSWLAPRLLDDCPPEPGTPALVLYTSGSTGRPKGVMLSHASQMAIIDGLAQPAIRDFLARGPCVVAAPLFHMNGLVFSELAFALGGQVVLLRRFEAKTFIAALARYRVVTLSGVPTMVALLAQEREALAEADLSCVEAVLIGSAPLSESVVAQARRIFPRAAIINSYGTTEIGAGLFGASPNGKPRPPLSIGHPAPHIEMRLVNGTSSEEGVLEVRSAAGMDGYLNLPRVTAEKMREGWINTGDIMRRDADGYLYFVGRADDMFVCSGENVYPGEIERLLERHPDILEVAVVPLADEIRGQIPVAFIARRAGATIGERAVQDYVLARTTPHLHPRHVWFVERMPLSGVNKIDRAALARRAIEFANAAAPRPDSAAGVGQTPGPLPSGLYDLT